MDNIVICHECDGYGQVRHNIGTHNSKYEYTKCKECKGSGRLEETTITEHETFVPGGVKAKAIF